MPFVIKDVLRYKRSDRQIREIHEREYSEYLIDLRQKQQRPDSYLNNQYHLSLNHILEIERSHLRNMMTKQNQYDRIQHENSMLSGRLLKASQQTTMYDKNPTYQRNLDRSLCKRYQQRLNEYKRIHNDNQLLLQRINSARGVLTSKQQCDDDWKKHVSFMKKMSIYPENIDGFVKRSKNKEQINMCFYSATRPAQLNHRHSLVEPAGQLSITPLAILLNESS